jgi:hypothetical protein
MLLDGISSPVFNNTSSESSRKGKKNSFKVRVRSSFEKYARNRLRAGFMQVHHLKGQIVSRA